MRYKLLVKQGRFYEIKGRLQKCTMLIFFHLISLRFTLFLGTVSGLGTEWEKDENLSPFSFYPLATHWFAER